MNLNDFINKIRKSEFYINQIVHIENIPPKEPKFGQLQIEIPEPIIAALEKRGITRLYIHQTKAINLIYENKNIIVVTPTASGKTLCYNIPIFAKILNDPTTRALYIYPTKALARDQLEKILELSELINNGVQITAAVYDGDTKKEDRPKIRNNLPNIILTNPDMLHYGILPNHFKFWENLFRNLKFIVIDEIHAYRGVFGSNVAYIIRRLNRICDYYGSRPIFICCSATIANPKEFVEKLCGIKFEIVNENGAASGLKKFILWNPPIIERKNKRSTSKLRKSAISEATELFVFHVLNNIHNLTFTKARKTSELIFRSSRRLLDKKGFRNLYNRVCSYTGAYLADDRRLIEKGLLEKNLIGVITTNALELGIDIGTLDACILVGYPGTIISTWQQAGRSGRGMSESVVTLIAMNDPIDQFLMNNPKYLFKKPIESAIIDTKNIYIMMNHLLCAAYELALNEEDKKYFKFLDDILEILVDEGYLKIDDGDYIYNKNDYPASSFSIRCVENDFIDVIMINENNSKKKLLSLEKSRALKEVHEDAVYFYMGDSYRIESLDLNKKVALARLIPPEKANTYTEPTINTKIEILNTELEKRIKQKYSIKFGEVKVIENITAFNEIDENNHQLLFTKNLTLPPNIFDTSSCWIPIENNIIELVKKYNRDLGGSIHAIEHAMIAMLPLHAMCDRRDLGGTSISYHPQLNTAGIFIYDGYPGGIGLTEKGYEIINTWLENVLDLIKNCECYNGCLGCIMSPKCGSRNAPLDKEGAIMILHELLELPQYEPKNIKPKIIKTDKSTEKINESNNQRKELYRKLRKKLKK
ncbi:MAG: DEAD/DEAH box helicase [Candidatus Helarchaeota archaeon]